MLVVPVQELAGRRESLRLGDSDGLLADVVHVDVALEGVDTCRVLDGAEDAEAVVLG